MRVWHRWRNTGILAVMFSASLAVQAGQAMPDPRGFRLDRVVIVSRHGVRAPTKMPALIRDVTPDVWPVWPVTLGDITPRGESLITLLGAHYRQQWRQSGLLPLQTCPADGQVYTWTDVDQRTRKTGEAFLQGLAPGCGLAIHHQSVLSRADPLFHPVKAGVCRLDEQQARRAIEAQAGMPLAALSRHYGEALAQMARVLDFSASPYCRAHAGAPACTLGAMMPDRLHVGEHGAIALRGAVGLSATLAEMFLLQEAQGMPYPAWGRIDTPAQWQSLLSLHNVRFDLLSRTGYIARHRGSPLMHTVLQALNGRLPALPGITPQNRLLLLVGHDTNLANLSGILQTPWHLPGQPDNTPPGGELVFERWIDNTDHPWVRVSMVYQTLTQLRTLSKQPPQQLILALPGCQGASVDGFCPLSSFNRLIAPQIVTECLPSLPAPQ